jgi:pyruvate dehydrogenase E2 component (dihydrolipoamide acetyltransferase)
MAVEFQMPKLGLTMEEGTIVEWLVADDAEVVEGTPVVRIETDKVETEVEVNGDGRLHHIAQPGEVFPCGAVIAVLLVPGEAAPSIAAPVAAMAPAAAQAAVTGAAQVRSADGRLFASPNARRVAAERGIDIATVVGTGPNGRIVSEDVPPRVSVPYVGDANPRAGVVASVAARNLADLLGIDLAAVAPDPVERRVTRDGVAAYVRQQLMGAQPTQLSAASQTPTRVIRMAGMRGTIAKRMHASLGEMAQLTLTMDADMDAVVVDRQRRKETGTTIGFTDYVVAAAARALAQHPNVNAQVTNDGIAVLPDIHVALAVALDNGLVVPVVRHTDRLDLAELSSTTTRLADAARNGTLQLDELDGGTFSVTALGMFGVDAFTPVINPPNAAILGVGRLREDVVLVDGTATTTKRLTLSLTWDHRVIDGAPAAAFCKTIVELLADPASLD